MSIPTMTINVLPVFVSAFVGMFIGFFWFSALFGKVWMRENKITRKEMEQAKKKGMGKTYVLAFICVFVTAYVLAHFMQYLALTTVSEAAQLAFWIWLGFFATTQLGMVLWDNKSWTLYFITTLHYLVVLIAMSAVLAVW